MASHISSTTISDPVPPHRNKTPPSASTASTLSPPTSPPPATARRPVLQPAPYTIRTITGTEHCPVTTSPTSNPAPTTTTSPIEKRYPRQRIAVFRTAAGEECLIPPLGSDEEDGPCRPRISSVTDISVTSPDASRTDLPTTTTTPSSSSSSSKSKSAPSFSQKSHVTHIVDDDGNDKHDDDVRRTDGSAHVGVTDTNNGDDGDAAADDDDGDSTYSHASAVNLDDLDDDDMAGLRLHGAEESRPVISRQVLDLRRQSFANSLARAREAKSKRAVVPVRPELQPHNRSLTLMERCVTALTEVLDVNLNYAKAATERFVAFHPLYTLEERQVIAEVLRETTARLRKETPTNWRTPLWGHHRLKNQKQYDQSNNYLNQDRANFQRRITNHFMNNGNLNIGNNNQLLRAVGLSSKGSGSQYSNSNNNNSQLTLHGVRRPWLSAGRGAHQLTDDTLVRSVVFGAHVIPGAQSAEAILLRMAGEFHREEVTRKASRAERVDVPLSFAMTLTAALATFARLECATSYRKYRSRNASHRRSSPHALIWLKTKYDGMRLSFGVTLHGESPCTVLFKRPRVFSLRKIDDYATLVTEAKDILAEFGRDVLGPKDS